MASISSLSLLDRFSCLVELMEKFPLADVTTTPCPLSDHSQYYDSHMRVTIDLHISRWTDLGFERVIYVRRLVDGR